LATTRILPPGTPTISISQSASGSNVGAAGIGPTASHTTHTPAIPRRSSRRRPDHLFLPQGTLGVAFEEPFRHADGIGVLSSDRGRRTMAVHLAEPSAGLADPFPFHRPSRWPPPLPSKPTAAWQDRHPASIACGFRRSAPGLFRPVTWVNYTWTRWRATRFPASPRR